MEIINTELRLVVTKTAHVGEWQIEIDAQVLERPNRDKNPVFQVWLHASSYDETKRCLCRRRDKENLPKENLSTENILEWFHVLCPDEETLCKELNQETLDNIAELMEETIKYFNIRLGGMYGRME